MTQNGNPASAGTLGGADCKAQQLGNPFKPVGAKNKAPTARRLIGARYSDAAPQTALAAALLQALARRAGAA